MSEKSVAFEAWDDDIELELASEDSACIVTVKL